MSIESELDLWNTLSGAELIKAMGDGRFPQLTAINDYIGQSVVDAGHGRVTIDWTPEDKLCNPGGTVHGGYIAMILDNAVCLAAASTFERFTPMLTLSLSVEYLRPVPADRTYRVEGVCVHPGRTRMLSNATITDAEGRLIAQATASVTPNQAFSR
ncbi:PaaI family thioesterase [Thermomonospora amylolytica]|uniref:PaaI family thioesterase n=1 Tax=Thermomonospora amylolytica TaxID=1411117 RepID=UPI000E6D1158|nr:PaaI family thioesterase [Thermomonospora amylolytica]